MNSTIHLKVYIHLIITATTSMLFSSHIQISTPDYKAYGFSDDDVKESKTMQGIVVTFAAAQRRIDAERQNAIARNAKVTDELKKAQELLGQTEAELGLVTGQRDRAIKENERINGLLKEAKAQLNHVNAKLCRVGNLEDELLQAKTDITKKEIALTQLLRWAAGKDSLIDELGRRSTDLSRTVESSCLHLQKRVAARKLEEQIDSAIAFLLQERSGQSSSHETIMNQTRSTYPQPQEL